MPLLPRIKHAVRTGPALRRWLYEPYLAAMYRIPGTYWRRQWEQRIADVLASPDLSAIPCVADAGQVRGGVQVMHNGLLVETHGYYGRPVTDMLRASRGVHEPQEEKAFATVLPFIPPGGVMIELGAYWAFYSMWFATAVPQARNILVEPTPAHLAVGQRNFARNRLKGSFHRGYVGAESGPAPAGGDGTPILCVDDLIDREGLDFVHILHADVQGAEHDMLNGARRAFAAGKIGYVFISTHGDVLHGQCRAMLRDVLGLRLLADATSAQSYAFDGLLVARAESVPGPDVIPISHKPVG